jgi:hypothetical protein
MAKVFLISEQTIKQHTLINDNVDGVYLAPAIEMAQDIDLTSLIGQDLIDKLSELVLENKMGMDENKHYQTLLDKYITPYLCWLITSNIQIAINYKLTNSGVVENTDERIQRLSYNDSVALLNQYQHYANAYATKLLDYLCDNHEKFPEYKHCDTDDLQLCNIYLPK